MRQLITSNEPGKLAGRVTRLTDTERAEVASRFARARLRDILTRP
ncbi:hypothetical protein [Nonomuraea sediminis]|nr:hypothetical protein [Nonomuraea sediminis]